jgi:hypothetical protein
MAVSQQEANRGGGPLPAPHLAFIEPAKDEMVPVRRCEVRELAAEIEELGTRQVPNANGWALTWFGLGTGATLALVPLVAVEGNHVTPGVLAGLAATAFIGVFLAGYLGWVHRKQSDRAERDAEGLARKLRALEERAPRRLASDEANEPLLTSPP